MRTALSPGEQILHYRVIEKIGEGGMGVVFKAEDLRLKRTVAVKLLQPSIAEDPLARERFLREARAASTIDHPNLCSIYTVEEAADGSLLLVMAYCEGKTVAQLLNRGPLEMTLIRSVGRQTAAGLHAAHMSGIIHRDIKPGNIFLLHSGTVKILDFGLSRIAHEHQLTAPHQVMGTLSYMPPEQLAGDRVDHRADIWALGVVLYEMAAGHSPFSQPSQAATVAAITSGRYIPLRDTRPDLPHSVHTAVERALRLQPHERHSSAAEFMALLSDESVTQEITPTKQTFTGMTLPPAPRGSSTAPTEVFERGSVPAARTDRASSQFNEREQRRGSSIAVLPMQNVSSDPENDYFSDGLTDELISTLGMLPGLRVVSRTSVFSFKGKSQNIREIGKALDVDVILEGSVRRSGARIRVTTQLTDVRQGFHIWSSRFDREISDVFELQDELASAVVSALKEKLAPDLHDSHLQAITRMQTEAYEAYLKGRYHWEQKTMEGIQRGGHYFEQALQLDPDSAAAHAGVADFYSLQGTLGLMSPHNAWQIARSSALRAIALDPDLPEGHLALANVLQFYDWDRTAARQHIVKAIELRPQRGESYFSYVTNLTMQGFLDEALEQTRIGLKYDPLATPLLTAEAALLTYLGDHDSSILLAQKALNHAPHSFELYYALGLAQSLAGRTREAVETFERGLEQSRMPILMGWLAEAHVRHGAPEKAHAILANLLELAQNGTPFPVAIAVAAASLGDSPLAFTWLEKAAEMRDILVSYVTVFPSLRTLHDEQRYHQLLERMNLKHPSTHRRKNETWQNTIDAR